MVLSTTLNLGGTALNFNRHTGLFQFCHLKFYSFGKILLYFNISQFLLTYFDYLKHSVNNAKYLHLPLTPFR